MNAVAHRKSPQLRPMHEYDLEAVAQIEQQNYAFPWTFGIFRDCVRAGYGCLVLERDGEVIGYGIVSVAAGEAHVLNVSVSADAQGKGYGRRMMRRLIDIARWHRASRVYLEVRPSNARAIALYHDLGFNEIGRRPGYYPASKGREDALVMALELLDAEGMG